MPSALLPLLLAGCADTTKPPAGDPSPTHDAADDTADTSSGLDTAPDGDTGGGNVETGTPDDTAGDTAGGCGRSTGRLRLDLGGATISPYDVRIVPDIDGKGVADVVVPYGSPDRGFAVYLGESLAVGGVDSLVVSSLLSAQATHTVGVAGDLDGDGFPELALGEARPINERDPNGAYDVVVRWWSAIAGAEVGRLTTTEALHASTWSVPARPLPDIDGDGVPEVAVGSYLATEVFSGATVGAEMSLSDAMLVVTDLADSMAEATLRAAPDVDGDGIDDLLVPARDCGLRLLSGATARGGGTLSAFDLPPIVEASDCEAWGDAIDTMLLDVDGDGLDELFVGWGDRVTAWRGDEALAAMRGEGAPLDTEDAWIRSEVADSYLGAHLVPWTDGDCDVGIAVSAHFADVVYTVPNAVLLAGGDVVAVAGAIRGGGWAGYALGGGEDVDGDGAWDLAVGTISQRTGDSAVVVSLGP